ncbi:MULTISPECIES: prepilin-type N-terminal cleavage/methylation domain-containing protein [Giesbergeria]|uniref:Prepilin-type N-terminal cleavage/methylation domain-containing protein n=1 Tax=Giesbergeria sinuosa TaxID=80883 RepID=A0ABV9QAW2_9BURK
MACRHPAVLRSSGFTLIELLLVLVLIGIGTGLAIVSVDKMALRANEKHWLDRTQLDLKRLRNKAVLGGGTVQALVDFKHHAIVLQLAAQERRPVLELPPGYQFRPASDEVMAAMPLVFYPDGSLSEARFLIRTPTGMQQIFHLAKISGRIERQDWVAAAP